MARRRWRNNEKEKNRLQVLLLFFIMGLSCLYSLLSESSTEVCVDALSSQHESKPVSN